MIGNKFHVILSTLLASYLRDEGLGVFVVVVILAVLVRRRRLGRLVSQRGGSGDGLVVLMADLVEELRDDGHCKK